MGITRKFTDSIIVLLYILMHAASALVLASDIPYKHTCVIFVVCVFVQQAVLVLFVWASHGTDAPVSPHSISSRLHPS